MPQSLRPTELFVPRDPEASPEASSGSHSLPPSQPFHAMPTEALDPTSLPPLSALSLGGPASEVLPHEDEVATPSRPPAEPSGQVPGGPLPGKEFHGLRVHSMLGEGGMGAAFLASHPVLRMPLVIKTFKAVAPTQIFREAHLAARVQSAHVVAVLDAGVEAGVPFVVQRYVDGIDLEELLRAQQALGRPLPIDMVVRLLLDVTQGLQAIHQAGVVHRDVKPANLFLSGAGTALVGDFGIAVERTEVRTHGPVVGTPQFMAPEQWHQALVDRRTDLYALGGTGHLLCTNRPPFQGESALQLGVLHVTETYTAPTPRDPREAYLFSVIERLLRKRPDERYATAEGVARALKVVVEPGVRYTSHTDDTATVGEVALELVVGDLAEQSADVLVSAANPLLLMDVGVARALREAGGDEIEEEATALGRGCMGEVLWTGAGKLKARYIAHAIAALDGAICVQRATLRVLLEAERRGCTSLAFPALGTGVGEVPMALGAKLMLEAVRTFAQLAPQRVRTVRVVLRDEASREPWRDVLHAM